MGTIGTRLLQGKCKPPSGFEFWWTANNLIFQSANSLWAMRTSRLQTHSIGQLNIESLRLLRKLVLPCSFHWTIWLREVWSKPARKSLEETRAAWGYLWGDFPLVHGWVVDKAVVLPWCNMYWQVFLITFKGQREEVSAKAGCRFFFWGGNICDPLFLLLSI